MMRARRSPLRLFRALLRPGAPLLAGLLGVASASTGCLERREGDTSVAVDECTTCHGGMLDSPFAAAPPFNLAGDTAPTARGVGAHAAHLGDNDWARPIACAECHLVPTTLYQAGHVDTEYPAEVTFSGPALAFEASPFFDADTGTCQNTFCHGGSFVGFRPSGGEHTEPSWTAEDPDITACNGCHGLPPPDPHPVDTECSTCHENIRADWTFSAPELHINGVIDFYLTPQE